MKLSSFLSCKYDKIRRTKDEYFLTKGKMKNLNNHASHSCYFSDELDAIMWYEIVGRNCLAVLLFIS